MNARKVFLLAASSAAIFLSGCGVFPAPEPTAAVSTAAPTEPLPTPTSTASPEPTTTQQPTSTPELPTLTPAPAQPALAEVLAKRLNLRTGPGTVFPILDSLEEGEQVIVIGKALGDEWVKVELPGEEDGEDPVLTGWLAADLLALPTAIEYLGYTDVQQSWLVEGKVLEEQGSPVDGVAVAVSQGMGPDEMRTNTYTLDNGRFYAYLPWDAGGIWQVSVTGVACSSRLMLDDCEMRAGYYLSIPEVNIEVPGETPVLLLFAYSEGGVHGTVYVDGEALEDVRVRGESASGAVSWDFTETDGSYELALGEGVWTVYAVDDDTGRESESLTAALGAGQLLTDVDIFIP